MSTPTRQYRSFIEAEGVPIDFKPLPSNASTWQSALIRSRSGAPKPVLANVISALRLAPEWNAVLAFDEFGLHTVTRRPTPWRRVAGENWTDYDDARTCEWLQRCGILVNTNIAAEAVETVARENPFHPVRTYLKSLRWDGQPRINRWLVEYLGESDSPVIRAVGSRWLIAAVARIEQPGCQSDYTLLLEGPQGIRKSSSLRVLASDRWFSDHISELGSKDSRLDLHGKWIIELAELDRVRRGDVEKIKAFLTARTDHFRPPYGRRSDDIPRSCIFAATVNDQTPLLDATGNRRFWPIRCGRINIEHLERDRNQLWAEAYREYRNGKVWWLDSDELNDAATEEQNERYEAGVWDETIAAWLEDPKQSYERDGHNSLPIEPFHSTRDRVTITDVLRHAVGKRVDHFTQNDRTQVVRYLTYSGWKRVQERSGPLRGTRFYVRPSGTSREPVAEPDVNR